MYIANTVMMNSSQFSNNSCKSNGGAVYTDYGTTATLNNCTLMHNNADQSGLTAVTHLAVSNLTVNNWQLPMCTVIYYRWCMVWSRYN
jgi:predicted outer membrane repeat protein